jgi:hypothetical protein
MCSKQNRPFLLHLCTTAHVTLEDVASSITRHHPCTTVLLRDPLKLQRLFFKINKQLAGTSLSQLTLVTVGPSGPSVGRAQVVAAGGNGDDAIKNAR